MTDPYRSFVRARPRHYLYALNPLAKLVAVLPAMAALLFTRDILTPLLFLMLALAVIVTGARIGRRTALLLGAALPVLIVVFALGFGAWTDPAAALRSTLLPEGLFGLPPDAVVVQVGDYRYTVAALGVGLATSLRLCSILTLSLIAGLTTAGPDLVRSLVQNLRVPYRFGYTALAAYRFVPRFGRDLEQLRAARRVRGAAARRGPAAWAARTVGMVVPLLAGGIRHAERMSFAMDSRAFGASRHRTERYSVPWRARDTAFVVILLLASLALFVVGQR
ncbi:energy-coupling factor transporter transmembrane component T [Okibacterium fritillariae]|uniref:Energy-coupling factor transport system permease protein n=1 Tax=Okibacterium fritillariae TaxID=123320 RepID=A0A1T5KTX8_9MICO|nr:energy-coupling factor transporter transmembrane component T [Okibacterium fritillariae]SKC67246.1 energy-coupling factor transport system permease protein [Okibacterium fritillariae]